jgi:hypothetical protein
MENNDIVINPIPIEEQTPPSNRPMCQGECGKEIPPYKNVPVGYQSPEIWYLEEAAVMGINAMRPKRKQLCLECYRTAWARRYPNVECQV